MVTRKDLIRDAATRLGGQSGTVLSGSGTTLVLGGLIGTTGDDHAYKGDLLFLLDAASELDRERLITTWDDAAGRATVPVRSTSSPANESYILVSRNDYTLAEYRSALNQALTKTPRSYRSVIPLVPGQEFYPLNSLSWLEGAGDVDAVFLSQSPNTLHNEDFSLWQTYSTPDGWTLSGTATRVEGFGAYAAQLTAGDDAATLTQGMPLNLVQWLARVNTQRETVHAGVWASCNAGSTVRIGISNGANTTWSDYHSGGGHPEYLSTSITAAESDTAYNAVIEVAANGTATVYRASLYVGQGVNEMLRNYGSQAFHEDTIEPHHVRNVGGQPVVEIPGWRTGYGQLVVTSRRPFAPMTSDDDAVDDRYTRVLKAGLLRFLLEAQKKNQDRTRLDDILATEARIWGDLTESFVDRPVALPANRIEVWGA